MSALVVASTVQTRTVKEFGDNFPHDPERYHASCMGAGTVEVPLSVPDGVLAWIELA